MRDLQVHYSSLELRILQTCRAWFMDVVNGHCSHGTVTSCALPRPPDPLPTTSLLLRLLLPQLCPQAPASIGNIAAACAQRLLHICSHTRFCLKETTQQLITMLESSSAECEGWQMQSACVLPYGTETPCAHTLHPNDLLFQYAMSLFLQQTIVTL